MPNQSTQAKSKSSRVGAGAAGAGGGTLLVMVAQTLSDSNPIKSIVLLLAPSLSVGMSIFILWVQKEISDYWKIKKMKSIASATKDTLRDALNNPLTSDEHKTAIRIRLEELELLLADEHMKTIRALSPAKQ